MENWKWIEGKEGVYQISDLGRVRRVRLTPTNDPCKFDIEVLKYLTPKYYPLQGDVIVGVLDKSIRVAQEVYKTFKGKPLKNVGFKNGNREDVRLCNLIDGVKRRYSNNRDRKIKVPVEKMLNYDKKQILKAADKYNILPRSLYQMINKHKQQAIKQNDKLPNNQR